MTGEEICRAIRENPLSQEDLSAILAAAGKRLIGEALLGAGLDLMRDEDKNGGNRASH